MENGVAIPFRLNVPPPLQPPSHAPSAPEYPRWVCLDLPQDLPEVRRWGQGIVGVPFPVLVPTTQRPFAIRLLEQGDGHSLGYDADVRIGHI